MPKVTCNKCGETWPRDPALEVECPQCKSPVGSGCKRPSGHGCNVHAPRDQLAMDRGFLHPCSQDAPFTLQNDRPKKQPEKFDERPKAKQLPLLRGANDEEGQMDLWDGAHVS